MIPLRSTEDQEIGQYAIDSQRRLFVLFLDIPLRVSREETLYTLSQLLATFPLQHEPQEGPKEAD